MSRLLTNSCLTKSVRGPKKAPKASKSKLEPNTLLLRDFIHDRLYGIADPKRNLPGGYFTRQNNQVGRLKEPINFSRL